MGCASSRWMLVGFLVAIGCFSESPSESMCRDGEVGCPCGVGCDAGLVCADDIDLCIPENCTAGSELCTCSDGQCFADLECIGGLCREPGSSDPHVSESGSADGVASTPGSVSDPSTTGVDPSDSTTLTTSDPSMTSMTDDPSFTSDPATTDPATTDPSMTDTGPTTDSVTDSDATESDTGMPIDGEPCHACILEQNEMLGNCEMVLAGCSGSFPCVELSNCVGDCLDTDDPSCIADCCVANPEGVNEYNSLAECHTGFCAQMCIGFDLLCGGG